MTALLVLVVIPVSVLFVCFVAAAVITHFEYRRPPGRGCDLCAGTRLAVMRNLPPCPQCGRTAR